MRQISLKSLPTAHHLPALSSPLKSLFVTDCCAATTDGPSDTDYGGVLTGLPLTGICTRRKQTELCGPQGSSAPSLLDGVERPECRADLPPCSSRAGRPARAARALAVPPAWQVVPPDAGPAPVRSGGRDPLRLPVRSGWARGPWVVAPSPCPPSAVPQVASTEQSEPPRPPSVLAR